MSTCGYSLMIWSSDLPTVLPWLLVYQLLSWYLTPLCIMRLFSWFTTTCYVFCRLTNNDLNNSYIFLWDIYNKFIYSEIEVSHNRLLSWYVFFKVSCHWLQVHQCFHLSFKWLIIKATSFLDFKESSLLTFLEGRM